QCAAAPSCATKSAPPLAVISHDQNVVFPPDIVSAAFGDSVFSHFARIIDVRYVNDVQHTARRYTGSIVDVELGGKDFVTYKDIVFVSIDFVGPGEPSITIKFAMIEMQLADEFRIFGATPFQSGADIQNHQAVAAVSKIGEPIFHLNIV